jgi:chaperone protein EcpD
MISGTRVIYKQGSRDVSLNLNNQGSRALLTQVWVDEGNDNAAPQDIKAPFIVTPPIARIDAGRGQTIRISYVSGQQPLPADRESVYWFNVLEIPAKPKGNTDQNTLQLAFRSRIKLFYRPSGLPGEVAKAPGQLQWQLQEKGTDIVAHVTNSSPYYISFNQAILKTASKSYELDTQMIAPKSNTDFAVKGLKNLTHGEITFSTINDMGGSQEIKTKV